MNSNPLKLHPTRLKRNTKLISAQQLPLLHPFRKPPRKSTHQRGDHRPGFHQAQLLPSTRVRAQAKREETTRVAHQMFSRGPALGDEGVGRHEVAWVAADGEVGDADDGVAWDEDC